MVCKNSVLGKVIGRIHALVECIMFLPMTLNSFTLRFFLLNVPGATSFVDLKTFEGCQYDTFVKCAKRDI